KGPIPWTWMTVSPLAQAKWRGPLGMWGEEAAGRPLPAPLSDFSPPPPPPGAPRAGAVSSPPRPGGGARGAAGRRAPREQGGAGLAGVADEDGQLRPGRQARRGGPPLELVRHDHPVALVRLGVAVLVVPGVPLDRAQRREAQQGEQESNRTSCHLLPSGAKRG